MAHMMAIGDMCLIAFYFLLWVGEYTSHGHNQSRRTKQFRAKDITFWDEHHRVIPNNAPLSSLLAAHAAMMQIDNQKNGTRGGMIHQDAIHTNRCPIRALARRVNHIMQHPNGTKDDIISTYFTNTGDGRVLNSSTINTAVN
jgi:hypothetical protein